MTQENLSLRREITRLEDLEAIKQLKARYCEICDNDHNQTQIVEIFTSDGVWEGEGIGRAEGHEGIVKLFKSFQTAISFSQHMVQNPIIEVDGDTATGRWYFFGTFTYYEGGVRRWQAARYHEKYLKQDGQWKIAHLKIVAPVFSAKYEHGWRNGQRSLGRYGSHRNRHAIESGIAGNRVIKFIVRQVIAIDTFKIVGDGHLNTRSQFVTKAVWQTHHTGHHVITRFNCDRQTTHSGFN